MTPYSVKLTSLRGSRGKLQKTLALELGVTQSYLSAVEQGRKSPPQNPAFYEKLHSALELSDEELKELKDLAAATEVLGPLAMGTSPMQLEVAMDFAARLRCLPPRQLRAIKAILETVDPPAKAYC